jgi:nucleotide-binding universal stress UspA family protein
MAQRPILIAYDGSEHARHAIEFASAELGGGAAEVVHAWEPLSSASSRLAVYAFVAGAGGEELEYERKQAESKAEEGAELARQAGFEASAVAIQSEGPVSAALIDYINERRPRLVVMGTRGLTGLRSVVAGSVSHSVSAHAHVPVLIVPPQDVSADGSV